MADSEIAKTANNVSENINKKVKRSFFRSKRKVIRYGLLLVNLIFISAVVGFIISTRNSAPNSQAPVLNLSSEKEAVDPLDTLSGADIAVNVALMTGLPQTTAVVNHADSANSQIDVVASSSQTVAKPQIVGTEQKSIQDLTEYVSVEGDTVDSIAEKFGVTSDTIRWSNGLTGNTVAVGTTLTISPVEGLVYDVKEGDTADSIARKYGVDESTIIAFNDAEITGLVAGNKIVIPDGRVPVTVQRSVPVYSGFRFGSTAIYGYNGYDYGYCTWYASNRRAEVGKPVPANLGNASTWKVIAQRAGIPVGSAPQKHAVIWTPPRDYYGHVGFVEEVYPDGSVLVSEMNVRGWGVRSTKVLTPAQAAGYQYIY